MSDPRPRILNAGRLPPALVKRLAERFELLDLAAQADRAAFLAAEGVSIAGVVTSAAVGIDAALLAALPAARVVSSFGVGLDRIDLEAARARGVEVGYTPDVLNDCVADLAFGLVLDVMRGMSASDRFVRRGDWLKGPALPARKVSGARLGLLGMGRIGRTIAKRSTGFEMAVRYHTRRPVEGLAWAHEPSLVELARWADVLVVITAGGTGTRHLVDATVLDALGPQGFVVNVARGSVIDEAALVRALREQRIAGAGLDVFEDEPRVPTELFAMDHVVLLPHIASATRETRQAMADLVFDNLDLFFTRGRVARSAFE